MQYLLLTAIVIVLLIIVWEDFINRAVHAFLFGILFVMTFVYSIECLSVRHILDNIFINAIFLFLQGILLISYFVIKHKRWINITETYIGWGDILYMVSILPLFSKRMFIFYYIGSLLLTILFVLLCKVIRKEMVSIPLAGIQALILVFVIVYHQFVQTVLFI